MKIKNFKINLEVIQSKFLKLKRFVLAGSLVATMLIGCGKESALDETLLEEASVITFEDGSKDIARAINTCSSFSDDKGDSIHYRSVITGERYSDEKCTADRPNGEVIKHYPIVNDESLTGYLTADEIAKAINGNLNDEDIIAIIKRVIEPTTELEEKTETSLEKTIN